MANYLNSGDVQFRLLYANSLIGQADKCVDDCQDKAKRGEVTINKCLVDNCQKYANQLATILSKP